MYIPSSIIGLLLFVGMLIFMFSNYDKEREETYKKDMEEYEERQRKEKRIKRLKKKHKQEIDESDYDWYWRLENIYQEEKKNNSF